MPPTSSSSYPGDGANVFASSPPGYMQPSSRSPVCQAMGFSGQRSNYQVITILDSVLDRQELATETDLCPCDSSVVCSENVMCECDVDGVACLSSFSAERVNTLFSW
jgi:hypothetical protein